MNSLNDFGKDWSTISAWDSLSMLAPKTSSVSIYI